METVTTYAELCADDIVRTVLNGPPETVVECVKTESGAVRVTLTDGTTTWRAYESPGRQVILVHRPLKPEECGAALAMLETAITAVTGQYTTLKYLDRLPWLHSALERWLLSQRRGL